MKIDYKELKLEKHKDFFSGLSKIKYRSQKNISCWYLHLNNVNRMFIAYCAPKNTSFFNFRTYSNLFNAQYEASTKLSQSDRKKIILFFNNAGIPKDQCPLGSFAIHNTLEYLLPIEKIETTQTYFEKQTDLFRDESILPNQNISFSDKNTEYLEIENSLMNLNTIKKLIDFKDLELSHFVSKKENYLIACRIISQIISPQYYKYKNCDKKVTILLSRIAKLLNLAHYLPEVNLYLEMLDNDSSLINELTVESISYKDELIAYKTRMEKNIHFF